MDTFDKVYVSNVDSGMMYECDEYGRINKCIKIGEHISDFDILDNIIYVISYFDNKITLVKDFYISKTVQLQFVPQKIIVKEYVYILLNDGYCGLIQMYTLELEYIKTVRLMNQVGELKYVINKLIFYGFDYTYIFSKTLNTYDIRKCTGKNLCIFDHLSFNNTE
jgi:hypothetical protein